MIKIIVDYAKCLGDRDEVCVEICPSSVFEKKEEGAKPKVTNVEACILCRVCEVNCPSQAIKILVS